MSVLWNWLNGKKTIIGAVLANIIPWFVIKGYFSDDTALMAMGIVNALTGVGLIHKVLKSQGES